MKAVSLSSSIVLRFSHSSSSYEAFLRCFVRIDQMLTSAGITAFDPYASENGVSPVTILGVVR